MLVIPALKACRGLESGREGYLIYAIISFRESISVTPYLSNIHDVFHVSLLRRYVADAFHILQPSEILLDKDLSFVERLVLIIGRKDEILRNKTISLVLV